MNVLRAASLCRQIGTLFLELADAIAEPEKNKTRKKPMVAASGPEPSPAAVNQVRRSLRRQGVVA